MLTTLFMLCAFQTPQKTAWEILPPKHSLHLDSNRSSHAANFLDYAGKQATRLLAKPPEFSELQLHLLEFRESSRLHNFVSSLGGLFQSDPGHFVLQLSFQSPNQSPRCLQLSNSPNPIDLLLADSFHRQAIMRRSLRRQLKRLPSDWPRTLAPCPVP